MPDKQLYKTPRPHKALASIPENERVRALYLAELEVAARYIGLEQGPVAPPEWAYERARSDFAREWVELGRKLGLRTPGEAQRARAKPGANISKRHADAAATRLRNFQEGEDLYDWMLVGIESVVRDRHGYALPPGAYQTQGRLI